MDEGRPTIDYPQYDDFDNGGEYQHRYSLHYEGGGNPMMNDSMQNQFGRQEVDMYQKYEDPSHEDDGVYYGRPSGMDPAYMRKEFENQSNKFSMNQNYQYVEKKNIGKHIKYFKRLNLV